MTNGISHQAVSLSNEATWAEFLEVARGNPVKFTENTGPVQVWTFPKWSSVYIAQFRGDVADYVCLTWTEVEQFAERKGQLPARQILSDLVMSHYVNYHAEMKEQPQSARYGVFRQMPTQQLFRHAHYNGAEAQLT